MKKNNIRKLTIGSIYKAKDTPEDVYAYIRAFRGNEVGFSVLSEATVTPDFSNCGVFWVKKTDFFVVFESSPYYGLRCWVN